MYTINDLNRDTILLTNSFIIKLLDIGIAIEEGLSIKYGASVPEDKHDWKYFKNIAGIKHYDNIDIYILLKETNENVLLTKETLDTYPYTKEELLKCGDYYEELLVKYPDEIGYIHGCMYPVDIDTAINAEQGTILNYNHTFVEDNELPIINKIERYIKDYLARYYIIDYTITDELYIPTLMGILFAQLPNVINTYRLNNIGTPLVHSFYMEQFFRSHLDIWDDISVLNPETKFWLYKNLRYLMKNTGRNKTLDTIATKIFEANGIGLGKYNLYLEDPTPTGNEDDVKATPYYTRNVGIRIEKLNDIFILEDDVKDLDVVIEDEINITSANETIAFKDFTKNTILTKIKNSLLISEETKILDIITPKLFKVTGIDFSATLLYNLIDMSDRYAKKINYTDPNTNINKSYTSEEAMLIVLKLFLYYIGNKDINLSTLTYQTLKTANEVSKEDLLKNLHDPEQMSDVVDYLLSALPDRNSVIIRPSDFQAYMDKVYKYYANAWLLTSNAENDMMVANMKIIESRVTSYKNYTVSTTNETIDQVLDRLGINFEITNTYNILYSIKVILKTFTGINIDRYEDINILNLKYQRILNKLTSYTLQVLDNENEEVVTNVYYNHTGILNSKGLITVTKADGIPFDKVHFRFKGYGNDFTEHISSFKNNYNPKINDVTDINNGIAYQLLCNELCARLGKPNTSIENLTEYVDETPLATKGYIYGDLDSISIYNTNYDTDLHDVTNINNGITYPMFFSKLSGRISRPNMSVENLTTYLDGVPMYTKGYIFKEEDPTKTYSARNKPAVLNIDNENSIITRTNELKRNNIVSLNTKPNMSASVEE